MTHSLHKQHGLTWIIHFMIRPGTFPLNDFQSFSQCMHAPACTHTHTYIHLDCIYHFFASSTSCVVGQHYSSHSYNWSLQSQLLSSKSEPCFNIASSARLIIFSLLLTAGLSFLKVTVAFAFLRESSLKFTF